MAQYTLTVTPVALTIRKKTIKMRLNSVAQKALEKFRIALRWWRGVSQPAKSKD